MRFAASYRGNSSVDLSEHVFRCRIKGVKGSLSLPRTKFIWRKDELAFDVRSVFIEYNHTTFARV